MVKGDFCLPRAARLRMDRDIGALFGEGRSGFVFPYRYYYRLLPASDDVPAAAMLVSVPKKMFKRAVMRNLLKRRTREAFRLERAAVEMRLASEGKRLQVAFVYSSREELPLTVLRGSVARILRRVAEE